MKLNDRQLAFCREYVIDHNASRAAIAVGYNPKTAGSQACRLLKNVNAQKEIKRLEAKVLEKCDLTAERVLKEYIRIAFADVKEQVDIKTGELKPDSDGALVGSISVKVGKDGVTRKVKFHDKMAALLVLAKRTGVVKDSLEITLPSEILAEVNGIMEKLTHADSDD